MRHLSEGALQPRNPSSVEPGGIYEPRASGQKAAGSLAGIASEEVAEPKLSLPLSNRTARNHYPIWAVGGGKGGTGKTFVSAALGQQLSRHGITASLVDADLGAPNLHTFLGVEDPGTDLSDFFYGDGSLSDVLVDAGLNGLRFVPGSNRHFNLSNLEYFRRLKLLRQITSLPGQTIVDTGAGAALTAIDFFNVSELPILVANANPASVENLFLFLEAVAVRIIQQEIRAHSLGEEFSQHWRAAGKPPVSVPSMFKLVAAIDSSYCERIKEALGQFQPCLIVNKVRNDHDVLLGRCLEDVAKRCLGTQLHYVGAIPADHRVTDCLNQFRPFIASYPDSETAVAVMLVMDRLLQRSEALEKTR